MAVSLSWPFTLSPSLYCSYTPLLQISLIRRASLLLRSDGQVLAWSQSLCFEQRPLRRVWHVLVGVVRPSDVGEGADGTKKKQSKKIQIEIKLTNERKKRCCEGSCIRYSREIHSWDPCFGKISQNGQHPLPVFLRM
jgi:hypothetical protein